MKTSKDGRVVFDPVKHTYYLGTKMLTGVTTFIGRYKQPFDAFKIATAYCVKNGGNVANTIAMWKKAGDDSCIAGSAVHDVFEQYALTGNIAYKAVSQKELVAAKFIVEVFMSGRLTPVEVECIVYDEKLGIASMIDMVACNNKGQYFILDWKSNKEIKKDSWGKNMTGSFANIPDSNFYHYSLQLGLYKAMYKEHSITGCYIVHIDESDYKIIEPYETTTSLDTLLGMGRLD